MVKPNFVGRVTFGRDDRDIDTTVLFSTTHLVRYIQGMFNLYPINFAYVVGISPHSGRVQTHWFTGVAGNVTWQDDNGNVIVKNIYDEPANDATNFGERWQQAIEMLT